MNEKEFQNYVNVMQSLYLDTLEKLQKDLNNLNQKAIKEVEKAGRDLDLMDEWMDKHDAVESIRYYVEQTIDELRTLH